MFEAGKKLYSSAIEAVSRWISPDRCGKTESESCWASISAVKGGDRLDSRWIECRISEYWEMPQVLGARWGGSVQRKTLDLPVESTSNWAHGVAQADSFGANSLQIQKVERAALVLWEYLPAAAENNRWSRIRTAISSSVQRRGSWGFRWVEKLNCSTGWRKWTAEVKNHEYWDRT